MYRFERAADCRALIADTTLWDSLAGDCPFRQAAWLGVWWQQFGADERAFFVIARDDTGQIRGLLPLYSATKRGGVLRFVADGQACSDGLSILCNPGDASTIGSEMGHWLGSNAGLRDTAWHLLDLDGVIAGDVAMIAFVQGLTDAGAWTHAESRMHTWFKPTTDTWDEYLYKLGKSRRRQTRRLSERIAETPELSLHVSLNEAELRSDLDAMIELHQRRWNEVGQPGSYADPQFCEFIHKSANRFLGNGRLRMCTLRHCDQVIAGELQFIAADASIAVYSSGVDMRQAELKPGKIINVETIRHAYEHSLPGIDYMRGDEPYKAELLAEPRRIARLRIVPKTAWRRIQHAAWKGAFELKQWARRRKGSEPIAVLPGLG